MLVKYLLFIALSLQVQIETKAENYTLELRMPYIHPTKNEQYVDYELALPVDKTSYIVSFEPIADMKTVHHLIIRGCEMMTNIGPSCISGMQIMYAWAKNAPSLSLPPGVGFKVGKDTPIKYLFLQIHYANIKTISADGDNSGVILHMTDDVQPKLAKVYLVYPSGSIPPNSVVTFETVCQITADVEMHPFAFRTHTHARGVHLDGYVIKENLDGDMDWQLIGDKDPQLPQYFYPVENKNLVARKGDWMAARCLFKNTENRTIYTGGTSEDEMCNFYIMYFVTDGYLPKNYGNCINQGTPYRWKTDPHLNNVPQDLEVP